MIKKMIKLGKLPKPGEGPSPSKRAKNWFLYTIVGEAEDGRLIKTEVKGGDAGYDETAKMVSEAAVMLAQMKHKLLEQKGFDGGVVTPAFAFRSHLISALNSAGLSFTSSPLQRPKAKL
eukprot:CAMPEP_0167804264 /NCGR_PEP_ID=MMETSP0111_2-20121227/20368_1 /TAXON_ID=91324 /ORGANISM="Lotharella globosa, Strain CCCM811" /LENGTH=118 /DNA_ID=CAMNT_0007700971 /DNA_START=198 /DNA_END=554 /DNA_ORIENTATION=-